MNGKNIKNGDFIVSSDDGSIKSRSAKFNQTALEFINKLTVINFANASDLKTTLPSSLKRLFYKHIIKNGEYKNTFCYGKDTKFSNNCIRWFIYNISKGERRYVDLCFDYETIMELYDFSFTIKLLFT